VTRETFYFEHLNENLKLTDECETVPQVDQITRLLKRKVLEPCRERRPPFSVGQWLYDLAYSVMISSLKSLNGWVKYSAAI
jgi:hypothetical protein